jgi:hypothetical protein
MPSPNGDTAFFPENFRVSEMSRCGIQFMRNSRFFVQTQKKLPIKGIHEDVLCETDISLKRSFSQSRNIFCMASFRARNFVLATVEI